MLLGRAHGPESRIHFLNAIALDGFVGSVGSGVIAIILRENCRI